MECTPRNQEVSIGELSPLIEELLEAGSDVELTATGNSMRPMLHDRQSRVRLSAPGELKQGDVPLYRRENGRYVLHRIVAVDENGYTCCGDAQWALERGIRNEQIVAVMTDFTWRGRWVSRDCFAYRVYWIFWTAIRPLRHLVLGGWRRLQRLLRI